MNSSPFLFMLIMGVTVFPICRIAKLTPEKQKFSIFLHMMTLPELWTPRTLDPIDLLVPFDPLKLGQGQLTNFFL